MTSVEALTTLKDHFEYLVRTLDLGMLLEYVRRTDAFAYSRHFKGYRPQTLGRKRVAAALAFEVFERKNTTMGDILTLLWNQERRDVYHAMHEHIATISEDVESIEKIEDAKANAFLDDMLSRFDAVDVLICVRLNEVRFSPEVIQARLVGIPASPMAMAEATPPEAPSSGEAV